MPYGKVVGLYLAPGRGEPTVSVQQVHVVPGFGIVGDRYFNQPGTTHAHSKSGQQITLIELETIEAICLEAGIQLTPDQTRRNVVTHGVSLNDLVGQTFNIGSLQFHGVRLCEPCKYLANRTDLRILQSMAHRGGLRAEIITDGIIHLDDIITVLC
jgi:MOSC domain-containing protein YiiM